MTAGAELGYRNGEYVQSAVAAATRLAGLADDVQRCLSLVETSWGSVGARGRWRGVAAWALRESLVIDQDPLRATVSALREASGVMADLAVRFRSAELVRWQARAAAVAAGSVTAVATSPADAGVDAPAVSAETAAAQDAARRLLELARRSRASRQERRHHDLDPVRRARDLVAELNVGASETLGSAFGGALGMIGLVDRVSRDPLHSGDELRAAGSGLWDAVRDPVGLASELVDADTWRTNPERAVGHLVPDVAMTLSGGTVAMSTFRTATEHGFMRLLRERELRTEAAIRARHALLERADQGLEHRLLRAAQQGWAGERGLRLSAAQCEVIARYLRESAAAQTELRRRMADLADQVGGRLTVLDDAMAGVEDHSVKDLGSLLRKVATRLRKDGLPDATGGDLLHVLNEQHDTVRYTIVLPEASYTKSARKLAQLLDRQAVAPGAWKNRWPDPGYSGINTAWTDVSTGVLFEVQLHTPTSRAASVWTHLAYEEARLPATSPERRARLDAAIAREYGHAKLPLGVEDLGEVPPPRLRGLAATPPEYGAVLVGGGLLLSMRSLSMVNSRAQVHRPVGR